MTSHDVRHDGRDPSQLRDIVITRNWLDHAEGSVLVEFGRTRVLCAASFTPGVPRWRKGSGEGWVTAEYAMLPRATNTRSDRESVKGRIGGRTHEISRLIGRSLRAVIDTKALGENTIVLDCDVLQADGGTRTAAITGAYVALADAIETGRRSGAIGKTALPLKGSVAAVSVGVVKGVPLLDLDYPEDSIAETDMNVVLTGTGAFVEIQGTAETEPFDRDELNVLLDLATTGCAELTQLQLARAASFTWVSSAQPVVARSSSTLSSSRSNGSVSAVPWISTKTPVPVSTTFMSVSAMESSGSSRSRSGTPLTTPTLTAATDPLSGNAVLPMAPLRRPVSMASASATYAPVIAAVLVPPSAWSTSQSRTIVFSPNAFVSMTARRLRPISREISWVRPPIRPLTDSRSERVFVARGSMAYSAVTQPSPLPLRQRGTPGVNDAAHNTRVLPNSTRTLPSAWSSQLRVITMSRS